MALYNRDYQHHRPEREEAFAYQADEQSISRDETWLRSFIKQTYQLFAASMLAGTVGAYVGMGMASTVQSFYWGLVILELALIFGLHFVRHKPGPALAVLFAFTFVTGLTITPLLTSVLHMPGGAGIVANAFLMTTAAFGGISLFAMNTSRDFSGMGKMLFIALIVLVVGGIVNIFLHSPLLHVMMAAGGAILFSFFILYDTQNIIRGNYDSPVTAAAALYLDFLNLFVSLLQLLGIFGGNEE